MQSCISHLFAALAVAVVSFTASAAEPTLGSPDFHPTPEHPVGWRGDWTGQFTGATPPKVWSRRIKGITSELRYQAAKPDWGPGKTAQPLEYFTIKDWLIAGPFSIDDPVKDFDKDFLGETTIHPAEGDKAGDVVWKFLRADIDTQSRHDHNEGTCGNLNVDFVYAFGKIVPAGLKANI